jgi:hypothetical protein
MQIERISFFSASLPWLATSCLCDWCSCHQKFKTQTGGFWWLLHPCIVVRCLCGFGGSGNCPCADLRLAIPAPTQHAAPG